MKVTQYIVSKAEFPIESIAIQAILKVERFLTAGELTPNHTDEDFVWEKKELKIYSSLAAARKMFPDEPQLQEKPNQKEPRFHDNCFVALKDEITEKEAIEAAIKELNTFEGNLEAKHTEDLFVFEKIRG